MCSKCVSSVAISQRGYYITRFYVLLAHIMWSKKRLSAGRLINCLTGRLSNGVVEMCDLQINRLKHSLYSNNLLLIYFNYALITCKAIMERHITCLYN